MNKKFLVVLLTLVLCLFIAGCSKPTLSLSETEVKLTVGDTYTINPVTNVKESDAVNYVVSDSSLLAIEGNKITALKAGTASVELSLKANPEVKASLSVIIEDAPAVVITGSSVVYIGENTQLTATLVNLQGEVAWESDNEACATVDQNGKVTGIKLGAATITATCGEYVGTFDINIQRKPEIEIRGDKQIVVENYIELKLSLKNLEGTAVWASSDETVATVDQNGKVTGVATGTATISATIGEWTATHEVEVVSGRIVISGAKTVYVGEEIELSAVVENIEGAENATFEWASSEDDVATVDQNGKVTGRQEGQITITASWNGIVGKYEIDVTLRKEVTVDGDTTVDLGDKATLEVIKLNVTGDVTWSSSDTTVATVDQNGVVTGVKLGTATITATVDGVNGTFEIEVIAVTDKVTYYYDGGSSIELYETEEAITTLTLTSYNANSGAFWGGGYSSNVYITNASGDPKATFSDRIYIGKNQYTGYYEIKSILTSGGSKWADGADYVISISSSYSDYRAVHQEVLKLNVGDVAVIFSDDITSISQTSKAKIGFYGTELANDKLVVQKDDYSGKLVEPVKLGHEFLGWYDSTGKKYESLSKDEISGNIKLTAKWNELNPVTDITINNVPSEMETNDTFQINASVVPSNAFFTQILYSTSNKDIISVSNTGLLTAVNAGTATITVKDYMGKVVKTYEITVNAIASVDVQFASDYTGVLKVNETLQLEPSYLGKAVDNLTFSYASDNTAVATVDQNGLVKAVSNGNAIITISTSNNKELKIGVTVNGLTENDKVDEVINLLVDNSFAEVEVGNACLYNDGTNRNYKATYGSVNRFLFDDLDINRTYAATAEANSNGHRSRRFSNGFNDSIEFVTVHDTATLTGTTQAIASNMASGGTSIHYASGNYEVYEVVPEKYIAYHAGDGTGVPFTWNATGVKATENVKPVYDITKVGDTWYFVLNGQTSKVVCPISNGSKTIANPSKAHLSNLGPVWKIVDGEYYIGNTWVCFSQVAAGVIGSYGGNNNSIGIEMSVNTSNDMYDTYQRTAKLVADILIRNNLDLTRVQQHNTWTGKNCPQVLIAGNYWDDFMKMVEIEYILAKDYSDVTITMTPDNTDIIDETGRVKNAPAVATTVGYTITVTSGSTSKSIKLYSVVPGTTSWEQWNGTYLTSCIWNDGKFVVNK